MKLLVLLGVLAATVACGGLSESDIDDRIQDAIGTAIATIPEPTVVPTATPVPTVTPVPVSSANGVSSFDVIKAKRIELVDGGSMRIIIDANIPGRGAELQIWPMEDGAEISLGGIFSQLAFGNGSTYFNAENLHIEGLGNSFTYMSQFGLFIESSDGSQLIFTPLVPVLSMKDGKTGDEWKARP